MIIVKFVEFCWPEKGDRAFKFSPSDKKGLDAFVVPSEGAYVVGFQEAANMVVDAAQNDPRSPDNLFFPVAYLYRHHLELMLKGLVRLGIRVGVFREDDSILKILGRHDLCALWEKAKQLISEACPDSQSEDIKTVRHVILEFHKLDQTGQAFRYDRDKKGAPHLVGVPSRVDLENMMNVVAGTSAFLDGAYAAIDFCDPGPLP